MKKKITDILFILIFSVALGLLLLVGVFCLPTASAKRNVEKSLYQMIDVAKDEKGSAWRKKLIEEKDNFTDYLMVQNALEKVEGRSALSHAIYVYHYDLENEQTWLTEESLVASLQQGTDGMFLREYSRYWHGYLVWLKPLLMCFSWSTVEVLLMVFQTLLLLAVVSLSFYRKQGFFGVGVLITLGFMKPLGIWASLTLMTCWTIAMLGILTMLIWQSKPQKEHRLEKLFLVIGIMTSYMDFLTYPIVTLGIPLCFYVVQSMDGDAGWWKKIKHYVAKVLYWGIGYVGMWAMKWIVAELFFGTGTLKDAVWSVIFRAEPLDGYSSTLSGVSRTIEAVLGQYDSGVYRIIIGAIGAIAFLTVLRCLANHPGRGWRIAMCCLAATALFPLGWLVFTQNHTTIHCSFTFRIMGITVMTLGAGIACSLKELKNMKIKNKRLAN